MALKECRECGKEVSTGAEACPNCGKTNPTGSATRWYSKLGCFGKLMVLVLVAVTISTIAAPFTDSPPPSNQADSSPPAASQEAPSASQEPSSGSVSGGLYGQLHTTCGGYPFTVTRQQLQRLTDFAASGDQTAWEQYVRQNPGVQMLRAGREVYVEDTDKLGAVIKIRPQGETTGFWTVREAIEKPCQ